MQTFDKIIIKMRKTHHRTGFVGSPVRSARNILGQLSAIDFDFTTETPRNGSLQLSRAHPPPDQFQKYKDRHSWSDTKTSRQPQRRPSKACPVRPHRTVQVSEWSQDIQGWQDDIQQQIDYSKQLKKLSINCRELSRMEEAGRKFKQILPQVQAEKTNKPAFIRINYKDSWKLNCFFNYDGDKQKNRKENTHRVLINKENFRKEEDTGSKSQRMQRRPRREALKMLQASLLKD